jgi:hypothetical protein
MTSEPFSTDVKRYFEILNPESLAEYYIPRWSPYSLSKHFFDSSELLFQYTPEI